jgi:ABC-type multidrug transport system ATPase subunit
MESSETMRRFIQRLPQRRRLSFDVLPGQIPGLVGPNGAGKATMRAIAGIIPATSGVNAAGGESLDGIGASGRRHG